MIRRLAALTALLVGLAALAAAQPPWGTWSPGPGLLSGVPLPHAASHQVGGGDPLAVELLATACDDGEVVIAAGGALVCGSAGAVSSVFGRVGAVIAESGDYTAAQVGAASLIHTHAGTEVTSAVASAQAIDSDGDGTSNITLVADVLRFDATDDGVAEATLSNVELGLGYMNLSINSNAGPKLGPDGPVYIRPFGFVPGVGLGYASARGGLYHDGAEKLRMDPEGVTVRDVVVLAARATAPTCTAGGMYYSSTLTEHCCCRGAGPAWEQCDGGGSC